MPKIAKFDLSTLNLDSGTYNITAKAKANGFNDSALSNTVEYVVAYPLTGQYLFNSVMSAEAVGFPLDFECNGERYDGITYTSRNVQNPSTGGTITLTGLFYYRGNDFTFVYNTSLNVWLEEYYRMITPLEGSIRDEFAYQYILANSTHYPLVTVEADERVFNDTLLAPQWGTVTQNIAFTSNGNSYTEMTIFFSSETGYITLRYGLTTVYDSDNGWVDENYKTFKPSESASVYYTFDEYLNQNAPKIYKVSGVWRFNDSIHDGADINGTFNLNFTSNGISYSSMRLDYQGMGYNIYYGDTAVYETVNDTATGTWVNESYRTITFNEVQTVSEEFYEWLSDHASTND